MTWDDLAEYIATLTDEQRQTDVTVYVDGPDEAYPVTDMREVGPGSELGDLDGVLDDGHPYMVV